MEIQEEIRKILPKLEIEIDEKYGFKREYYVDKNGRKIFISNSIIDKKRKLVAWIEMNPGFDDEVEVKIYTLGSINRLITCWKIFPINGSCSIDFMKFYDAELIIVWRDNNYHLVKIELPSDFMEVSIKMIKLRPLIHFDGKKTISYQYYQGQSSDNDIQRVKIPEIEFLAPLSSDDAEEMGIRLDAIWEYALGR